MLNRPETVPEGVLNEERPEHPAELLNRPETVPEGVLNEERPEHPAELLNRPETVPEGVLNEERPEHPAELLNRPETVPEGVLNEERPEHPAELLNHPETVPEGVLNEERPEHPAELLNRPETVPEGVLNRQQSHEEDPQVTTCTDVRTIITHFLKALLFVIIYTVCVVPFCVCSIGYYSPAVIFESSGLQINESNVLYRIFDRCFVWLRRERNESIICVLFVFLVLYAFSYIIITTFFISFLNLSLNLIIGLYLNGSFFSPIVVPIIILLGYSWKNWRSFVETKYLQFKTAIYECCQEYYEKKSSEKKKENEESKRDASVQTTSSSTTERSHQENEETTEDSQNSIPTTSSSTTERSHQENEETTEDSQNSIPTTSSSTIEIRNHQESEETTDDSNESYVVNVKEGTVSKALYDKIREYKLPYYNVLFYFSMRMFLVANFSLVVFVMMSLAQKSNIAVPVQIMSTIVVSTFPLIFETIWAVHSFEQKNVNHKKLKQDLSSIMKMTIKTDDIVNVQIKFKDRITEVKDFFQDFQAQNKMLKVHGKVSLKLQQHIVD